MRVPTKWVALASGLFIVSCGAVEEDQPTLEGIWDKPLDSLTGQEAEIVCREERARVDPCQTIALQEYKALECSQALALCKTKATEPPPCKGVSVGPSGSCPVSVGEYFACIDDWSPTQSCENAETLIPTPLSCQKLVSSCVAFAEEFYRSGPAPACEPPAVPPPPDSNDDIHGADGCRPVPARMVILGDSIADCYSIDPEYCAPYIIAEHLKAVSPGLVVESHAVSGAFTKELPAQAAAVAGGSGHVLVYVYAIGNDLLEDQIDWSGWSSAWNQLYAYFTDTTKFPDGATFLLNTQYSPYDQCPNPPGPTTGVSAEQEQLLQDVNKGLFIDVAIARSDTVCVDHYPDFLGHGQNANIKGCPHCGVDNKKWLQSDGVHPGVLGYQHMAEKWFVALDAMYAPGCS
jgi:hypothetical protein